MAIEKWKEISRELVFDHWRKIEKVIFELPDGKRGEFYLKKEMPSAAILALTKDKKIILAKQFRPGPNEVLLELPGGAVEENLNPLETAKKELLEETGYSGEFRFIASCYTSAYSNIVRNYFIATDCEKISEQNLEEGEFIEVELLSVDDFRKLLRSGKMTDIEGGYLCLDFLGLL